MTWSSSPAILRHPAPPLTSNSSQSSFAPVVGPRAPQLKSLPQRKALRVSGGLSSIGGKSESKPRTPFRGFTQDDDGSEATTCGPQTLRQTRALLPQFAEIEASSRKNTPQAHPVLLSGRHLRPIGPRVDSQMDQLRLQRGALQTKARRSSVGAAELSSAFAQGANNALAVLVAKRIAVALVQGCD